MHDIEIPRISSPSPEVLHRDYQRPGRAVIITDLFAGQPIDQIRTAAAFRELFASVRGNIMEGYAPWAAAMARATVRREPVPTLMREATIGEYFDLVARDPKTTLFFGDDSTVPDEVRKYFSVPPFCDPATTASLSFLSSAGNATDVHTDWHCQYVLLYQPFGRKRALLFPPEAANRLQPVEIFGNIRLRDFSEADKLKLVKELGGYHCVLNPGETLAIPRCFWHQLEYLDDGFGIAFRYGAVSSYAKYVMDHVHRDHHVCAILSKMLDEEQISPPWLAAFGEIKKAVETTYPNHIVKYRALRSLTRDLCAKLIGPESVRQATWLDVADLLEPVFAKMYAAPPAPTT